MTWSSGVSSNLTSTHICASEHWPASAGVFKVDTANSTSPGMVAIVSVAGFFLWCAVDRSRPTENSFTDPI